MEDILGDNARLRKKVGQLEALVRSLEDRIGSMSSEMAQVVALVRCGVQQGDLNAVKDQVQQVKNNIAFGVSNLQGSEDDITNKVLDNGAAISSVKKDVSNIKGEVSASSPPRGYYGGTNAFGEKKHPGARRGRHLNQEGRGRALPPLLWSSSLRWSQPRAHPRARQGRRQRLLDGMEYYLP